MKYFAKKYIVILVLLFSFPALAQNLKYKDIFEVVKSGDYVVAYNLLFEYQKQTPEFANTYFQLGLISYYNIISADPLLEYDRIEYFHYNLKLFWGLAKKFIVQDNAEVTRNRKYYQNVPELAKIKRLSAPDVLDFINQRLNKAEQVVREEKKIHDIFYKMVDNYSRSVDYYRRMVADYDKLKDMELAPEQEIFPRLDTLRQYFDSALNMYQQYKTAIASFPIKKYNQRLIFEPIRLYRLDGITNTDFLSDTIIFWNYGIWTKDVHKVINTDIEAMRRTIVKEYVNLTQTEKKLMSAHKYSDDYSGYYLLQKVIFMIEKYDLNSLASAILRYKKAKTDFLAFRRHKYNDTLDSVMRFPLRANAYYKEVEMSGKLDSLLDAIKLLAVPSNIKKHQRFIQTYFPQGLPVYVRTEKQLLNQLLEEDMNHYKFFLYRDIFFYPFVPREVTYKNSVLYLYPVPDTVPSPLVTMDVVRDPLGDVFVAGGEKEHNRVAAFVAKLTSGVLQWKEKVTIPDLKILRQARLFAYTDGLIAIFNYLDTQGDTANYIVGYNQFGKKRVAIKSSLPYMPVFLNYDDINNVLLAAYKGKDPVKFDNYSNDVLVIQKWNLDSAFLHWQRSFDFYGNLTNIIRFDTVYYAFFNCRSIQTRDKSVDYHSEQNAVGAVKISASGKISGFKSFDISSPFYLLYAYKLSSEKIDLTGFGTSPFDLNQRKFDHLPGLKSFIVNKF